MTTPRELQVGDRVRDNEAVDALGEVLDFSINRSEVAIEMPDATLRFVPFSRIHLDDKPRKTGWSRV